MSYVEDSLLKVRENGLMLSDRQVLILKNNGINYKNYNNIKSLVFQIESILNENYDETLEDLDEVSKQLSEISYYNYTNK